MNAAHLPEAASPRVVELFEAHREEIHRHTDRLFAGLMLVQWAAMVVLAVWVSPRAWAGMSSSMHPHVWAAVVLGGFITVFPVILALARPGATETRHVIAVAQMLASALLIHLTGGRIETHFHVFGSLAILSFYRDWRVLVPATLVVAADHLARGLYFPQSVYGVSVVEPWRWFEHAGWVVFEDIFLVISCRRSLREMWTIAERRAELESTNEIIERRVVERTRSLQQEVAERTRAEQQIRNRTARLDALVYNTPQAIVLVDNEHRIQMCNPAFEKMFGYSETETVGHRLDELVSPPDLVPEAAALTQRSLSGQTVRAISRRRRKDGSVVEVEIYGVPLLLDGQLLGGYGLYVDVSEQRKLENQLRQSQKMESLGQLAGGVAHDFNNLLGVIIGYSDLLLDKHPAQSPEHKNLEEIKKAGKRAAALTRQLLAFSRKQLLQPRVLDLNAVVADMDKMLQRLIGEDVALVTVPGPRLGCVKVDPSQIEQVVLNLAVNARDAMPKGGKLTIETASVELTEAYAARHTALKPGSYVMLAVSDTGVGMDADTQARIFDPFFTTKGPGKGTGLGLATVYGIVKQSGGFIWVYSEPDKGATFKIYFPRVSEEAPAAAAKPGQKPTRGTEVILLVEDEEALRELARQSLTMHGYSVLEAADPEHAVELSKAYHAPIDLMVTDVIMPGMSGPELAQILLRARPDMKLLYVSGYTDEAIVHHGVLDRDTAFLHKPFGPAELASKVREVLDKPEMLPPAPEPDGAFVRVF